MVSSLIVGGTGVSGSFIVSGLIERGHDVTVYTTGRTVPTEEESPWWYDGSITRLEGGVDSAEDVDATLTEAYGAEWSFDHVFVRSICSTPDPGPVHLPVHLLGRSVWSAHMIRRRCCCRCCTEDYGARLRSSRGAAGASTPAAGW